MLKGATMFISVGQQNLPSALFVLIRDPECDSEIMVNLLGNRRFLDKDPCFWDNNNDL